MTISTLVETAGSASANTYCTLVVADQYHDDRPPSATTWVDATDDEKTQALLHATRLLDLLVEWTGFVVDGVQALLWPRQGMWYRSEYSVPTDIIPTKLQEATAEFARQLLVADRAADSDVETKGITGFKAGPVAFQFDLAYIRAKVLPDLVVHFLPKSWYEVIADRGSLTREIRTA